MNQFINFLRTSVDWIPLTVRGAVLIVAAWLTLWYLGLQQHDRLLLAASIGAISLLTTLAMSVLAMGIWLRWIRLPALADINAMESVEIPTGLVLPSIVSIPCLVVEIFWINCEGVEVALARHLNGHQERIRPTQRLRREELVRQFSVEDVFGLCRVKFQRTFAQSVRVEPLPATAAAVMQVRRDQQGDDLSHPNGKPHGDLIEMRHYRPGDPLKLVLWKHYARTRQLLVRQPENSIASMTQTIACFVAGPGDRASAGVARTILTELTQSGEELLFQADGASSATDCSFEAIDQIIKSADMRSEGGKIVAGIVANLPANTAHNCIAFVPSQPGPWIETLIAGKNASQWQIDAIIGVDEPTTPRGTRFLPNIAFRPRLSHAVELEEVHRVVDRLTQAGIPTRVIHRRSGQGVSSPAVRGTNQ